MKIFKEAIRTLRTWVGKTEPSDLNEPQLAFCFTCGEFHHKNILTCPNWKCKCTEKTGTYVGTNYVKYCDKCGKPVKK